jgi:hypothetical protein
MGNVMQSMKFKLTRHFWMVTMLAVLQAFACGKGSSAGGDTGDPQTPPIGRANIEPWLSQGFYKNWKCEPEPHPARPFGPHGQNRVCSNDLLSAAGPGEYPVGSASVKEIYSGSQLSGYSVSLHNAAGTTGETYYWYERVGSGRTDAQGASVCVSCHRLAGTAPDRSGHDFVYTQVR